MIVCHCKGVTDRDLRRQFDHGVVTDADQFFEQGPGNSCGGCRPLVERLLRDWAARVEPGRDGDAQ